MPDRIPVQQLRHTTVAVRDLRAAARNYAEVYGIERWRVVHHSAERLRALHAFGSVTPFSYATATGANRHGVTFQLVQPTGGFSTFQEFLITRGPGIHGFCTAILDDAAFDELRRWLAHEGAPVGQSATVDGAATHHYFDMRRVLGNFYIQVTVPHREDWESAIGVDEVWDFAGEIARPPGVEPALEVQRVGHFGIAVNSVMEKLPRFARLFGLPEWRSSHFSRDAGLVKELIYQGEPVDHEYLIALTQIADFGLELLQPVTPGAHYRVDYLDAVGGDGIHHMLLHPSMPPEQWPPVHEWMEGMGAPVILTGTVNPGDATFYYTDTREKLGGYVYEVICRDPGSTMLDLPTARFQLDFPEARGD